MKTKTVIKLVTAVLSILFVSAFFPLLGQTVQAQESGDTYQPQKFSREELAQMLAPIALYPDELLTQVLMASTYPLEVIEADRWIKKNPGLKGEALDDALLEKEWDISVKALCQFPSLLELMSERISETANIGNAFLAQEDEVMDMIQELRVKARAQGNLTTNSEQKVIVEEGTIIIKPANPRIIWVPYYNPFYIYGPWWYPGYPPYYWGPAGVTISIGISYWPGFYFGFAFGNWCYFDWHRHYIYVDARYRPRFARRVSWRRDSGRWIHSPIHRRGVAYRDTFTAYKYGQFRVRTRELRPETRGFPEGRTRLQGLNSRDSIDRNVRGDRTRIERANPERQQLEGSRQLQQRNSREIRTQERFERERRDSSRDENIFNRVDNGRSELRSSTRGQYSRQSLERSLQGMDRGYDIRSGRENRGGGYNRGGRDSMGGGGYTRGGRGSSGGGYSRGGGRDSGGFRFNPGSR